MSADQERKLVDEAKIGDPWFVIRGHRCESVEKITVTKVVKTQITFSNGTTILRRTCRPLGSGRWDSVSYRPATEENTKEYEEQIRSNKARNLLSRELDRVTHAHARSLLSTDQRLALITAIRNILPSEPKETTK